MSGDPNFFELIMSFLFLTRKFARLAWSFAVLIPVVACAQSGFAPLNAEYPPARALPGSQIMPSAAVQAGGGYLVWQDQNTFGNRFTLMGRVLDSGFNPAFAPFRINSNNTGDHENAKVALLGSGGAVFVWQGGQYGFQHIYARFLSSSNTWMGIDQMVNSSSRIYQGKPAVAVLGNGNVVVVWETFNSVTMRDISGQLFSASGVKIGGEFQVNQFTPYNQRSASVAALTNGGFVVTWVSEQQTKLAGAGSGDLSPSQFQLPSVDVYARLFDMTGAAASGEFPVNASSNVCANPVVAAAADGSVMFAWSEKDGQVINNGWDIYSRPFTFPSSISQIPGVEQRVNTQLYGDQFAPQMAAQGANYLIVWTSLGQDGSAAGLFGQILGEDGSRSGGEFRVNTTTLGAQQQPNVAADNNGRFLATWTGPTFGPSKNDLFGQVYAGTSYLPSNLVTNYLAPVFVPDNSSKPPAITGGAIVGTHNPESELPVLNYPGQIALGGSTAPATNAFALAAGSYHGLFYEANGASPTSSGYLTAVVTAGKAYTASLSLGGVSYPFHGPLNALGSSGPTRVPNTSLTVTLQLDLFGGDQIRGEVAQTHGWTAAFVADRQVFNKTSHPTSFAGLYTMAIPGNATGLGSPGGSGYGTAKVDEAGNVTWVATLADGTKVSQGSVLSKSGIWPLYSYLSGGGCLISWITITTNSVAADTNQAVTGDLLWFKRASVAAKYYPAGFTNDTSVVGSVYLPPPPGLHGLSLSGGSVTSSFTNSVQIGTNYKVTSLGTNKVSVTLNAASGVFTGSTVNPGTGKAVSFQGVLLDGAGGTGFFLDAGRSGQVNLDQTHAP